MHQVEIPSHQWENFSKFLKEYDLDISINGKIKHTLGGNIPKHQRTCRFCLKKHPDVTFNSEAHVIPQLLNKSKITSSFECDICNAKFSKFESDFGHYFLVNRALLGQSKKKPGKPIYKTKKGTRISSNFNPNDIPSDSKVGNSLREYIAKNDIQVIKINQGIDKSEIAFGNKSLNFNLPVKPYIPINIFKIFLKIGLSITNEQELGEYSIMMKLLTSNLQIPKEQEFSAKEICMFSFLIPTPKDIFPHPIVHLFKTKNINSKYIAKFLVLFFGNEMHQIPFLSNAEINKIQKENGTIKLLKFSPYFNPYYSKEMFEDEEFIKLLSETQGQQIPLYKSDLVTDSKLKFSISQKTEPVYLGKIDKSNK